MSGDRRKAPRQGLPWFEYDVVETLHSGTRVTTERVREPKSDRTLLLRTPRVRTDSAHVAALAEELEIFRQIGRDCQVAGPESVGLGSPQGVLTPDVGGRPLDALIPPGGMPVADALRIAIAIAERIQQLHAERIVHKGVGTRSVLANPATGEVDLLCYCLASRIPRETGQMIHPGRIEGDLACISPEQTGRMNRTIDYRTDYYSFGATFYELLTGRPPFRGEDPVELVHSHIARSVTPPHEVADKVPVTLSRIVEKLLAKNAEDRYQSSIGLLDDLRRCAEQLAARGEVEPFPLAAGDVFEQFHLPQRLYGRESDVDTLLTAFQRAAGGKTTLVMVSGCSGIGKTTLVQELHPPVTSCGGYFIAGKHDHDSQNRPYHALAGALRDLTRQILTEDAEAVASWGGKLSAALGENAQLMIDLVPELSLVMGEQAAVRELPPAENEARFNTVLTHFIRVFAGGGRPLVVFLDDLQWVDLASLKFLTHLARQANELQLMIIGAYRDNEVPPSHPLAVKLGELNKAGGAIRDIVLSALTEGTVAELLTDILCCDDKTAADFAALLMEKTGGNPFFLLRFLERIFDEGYLRFDIERRAWSWNAGAIENMESSANVIDLMIAKLRELSDAALEGLRLASCIGSTFDLGTLALVSETTARATAKSMWEAVQHGVVLPIYTVVATEGQHSTPPSLTAAGLRPDTVRYRFLHDRVQQAAAALIEAGERKRIHLKIGRLLRETAGEAELDDLLFDIVGHLSRCTELLATEAERQDLIQLALRAGRRAKAAAAYESARSFLETGAELLDESGWASDHDLTLALHFALAECVYLTGEHEEAEKLFDELHHHVRTDLERARLAGVHTHLATHEAHYPDALAHICVGLALLGLDVPPVDQSEELQKLVATEAGRLAPLLAGRAIAELVELPEMNDETRLVEAGLLKDLAFIGMSFDPLLVQLATVRLVRLSIEHGNSFASAPAYATYGMTIAAALGQYEAGYAFGKMALALAERQEDPQAKAIARFWFGGLNSHWRAHIDESIAICERAVEIGLRVGAPLWASYAAFFPPLHSLYRGVPIAENRELFARYESVLDPQSLAGNAPYVQLLRALQGETRSETGFEDEGWGDEHVAELKEQDLLLSLQHYFVARLMGDVIFGRTADALTTAEAAAAEGDIDTMLFGQLTPVRFLFHHALAMADALHEGLAGDKAGDYREKLEGYRERLGTWAGNCPANFRMKHLLLEAEWAALEGDQLAAMESFDVAIETATAHGMRYHIALANERAARFYLRLGRARVAALYLRAASSAYSAWGARAKVAALVGSHLDVFGADGIPEGSVAAADLAGLPGDIDMASVLEAARLVSEEIEVERLLDRSMAVVIENAGAQRGVLLLIAESGELEVSGLADVDRPSEPVANYARSPVDYCRRTREPVVLERATADSLFGADPHIVATRPQSVLAMPLVSRGSLTGVLYLENRRSVGAFTPDRVQILEAICAQFVVSYQNARLFEEQRRMAESFARFVPTEFLESLGKKSIADIKRGDAVREEVTVLFSDLRDFTTLSEGLEPRDNFEVLNRFLERMEPVIRAHGGFIDKFIGDAITALFPGSTDSALLAAIEMQRALDAHNREAKRNKQPTLRMGIGMHSGSLILGTLGSESRLETTAIGDTVNLASRLGDLTKRYRVRVLVSGETMSRLDRPGAIRSRLVGRVQAKGKSETATVYELIDGDPKPIRQGKAATLSVFTRATRLFYERHFEDSLELFQACLSQFELDPVAQMYVEKCKRQIRNELHVDW